jgi:yersiniabactin nonribosomal peptide synthetase
MTGRGELAGIVRTSWQEILGAGDPGPTDDFFLCGGSSLLAIRLINRLRQALNSPIPVLTIFEHCTFGEFERAVEQQVYGTSAEWNRS